VETYMVESSSGPSRKYYRLTAAGRRALDGQTNEWRAFARAVEALIVGEGDDVGVAGSPAQTPAPADQKAHAEPTAQADRGEDQRTARNFWRACDAAWWACPVRPPMRSWPTTKPTSPTAPPPDAARPR